MASLYVLHLSGLSFLLMESLIILLSSRPRDQDRLLTPLLLSSPAVCVLLLGLAPGLLYTIGLVIILRPSLCWLDVTSVSLAAPFLAPIGLISVSSLCVLTASRSPSDEPGDHGGRSLARLRPCVLLASILQTLVCVLGPLAHTRVTAHTALIISYHGVRAGLAVAVILRTLMDDQVRHGWILKCISSQYC